MEIYYLIAMKTNKREGKERREEKEKETSKLNERKIKTKMF